MKIIVKTSPFEQDVYQCDAVHELRMTVDITGHLLISKRSISFIDYFKEIAIYSPGTWILSTVEE